MPCVYRKAGYFFANDVAGGVAFAGVLALLNRPETMEVTSSEALTLPVFVVIILMGYRFKKIINTLIYQKLLKKTKKFRHNVLPGLRLNQKK